MLYNTKEPFTWMFLCLTLTLFILFFQFAAFKSQRHKEIAPLRFCVHRKREVYIIKVFMSLHINAPREAWRIALGYFQTYTKIFKPFPETRPHNRGLFYFVYTCCVRKIYLDIYRR